MVGWWKGSGSGTERGNRLGLVLPFSDVNLIDLAAGYRQLHISAREKACD